MLESIGVGDASLRETLIGLSGKSPASQEAVDTLTERRGVRHIEVVAIDRKSVPSID